MPSFSGNIPNQTPFLIERVGGDAGDLKLEPATSDSAKAPPPKPAAHAAVTEDFKNSRRVEGRMDNLSAPFIQVDFRVPYLFGFHHFFPSHFASRVSRRTRHHARKRGLAALGCLVMKVAAGDAFHECFLLFAVRKFQVGREISRDRKGLLFGAGLLR